jgi:ubiquinone/menaquinone biosynthesis C-methylase UbiE
MWSAGDYDSIATFFWDVGAIAVEAAAIEPAMAVLDVATGTGDAAVRAAQAGAAVTGLDLTPELSSRPPASGRPRPA